MSRCFPFPPPGYEKKTRSDDVDLLIKDKKDKKHKKEKRDKKEGKDKDRERSKDKDGEKKDRKEKHKDKKKSKNKEKKDEKKIGGQPEGPNGGVHSENHQQAEAVKDTKFMEIGRRVADEERGRRDQMVENLPRRDQMVENLSRRDQMVENLPRRDQMLENLPRRDQMVENLSRPDQMVENLPRLDSRKEAIVDRLVEKYFDSGFQEREKVKDKDGHDKKTDRKALKDEGRVMENTVLPSFTGAELRRVGGTARPMENKGGQAHRDEGRVMENTAVPSFTAADQRRVGVTARPMDTKDGRDKKTDRHTVKDEGRVTENIMVSSFSGAEQRRVGSTARPEKETERKMEGKEKNKDMVGSDKQGGKHTRKDGEKKKKHKKAAEKEKMKEKIKHENRKQDMLIEFPKDHINTLIKPIQIPKDTEKSGNAEENLRKRKDCETNGFLHEHDVRPNKLLRPTLSPHPLTLNGRNAEPCQPATPLASAMPRGPSNIKFDNKVLEVNGLIQAQPTSIHSTSPSIPPVQARENSEASKKSSPPHPDSKYLSQILTVPKLDDLSDFDDQEWLFSSDSLQEKKPKAVSSGVDGSQQVWDRALRIDSADVCALPYVIPY